MRIKKRILPSLIFMAVALLLAACSASGCYENHSAIPLAAFYSESDNKAISISNIEIGGVDAPDDSLLVKSGDAASEVYLPFRFNRDELTFFIRYMDGETVTSEDYVTFKYRAIPFFAGEACGALYNYRIEEVTHTDNVLKKVELADEIITNINRVYIRFYFQTSAEGEDDPNPEEPVML